MKIRLSEDKANGAISWGWRFLPGAILAMALILVFTLFSPIPASADGGAPQLAYVAGGSHGVSVIDIAQQKVTNSFPLDGDPHTVLLSLDGRFLYVTQPALGR